LHQLSHTNKRILCAAVLRVQPRVWIYGSSVQLDAVCSSSTGSLLYYN